MVLIPDAWKRLQKETEKGESSSELGRARRDAVKNSLDRLGVPQVTSLPGDFGIPALKKPGLTPPVNRDRPGQPRLEACVSDGGCQQG